LLNIGAKEDEIVIIEKIPQKKRFEMYKKHRFIIGTHETFSIDYTT